MGTDCKSAAFQLRWFESTRAHQEIQYPNRVLDFLFCRLFSGLGGWIRTASARRTVQRAKKPQWGFFRCAARDIHPRPPKKRNVSKYAAVFFYDTFSCYFCFAHLSEQLCKNTVLHNKPGGGQGEGTAIKGGIPGADTVLHKGQLRGGKLLAVQGFVGFKVKPLAQTQL